MNDLIIIIKGTFVIIGIILVMAIFTQFFVNPLYSAPFSAYIAKKIMDYYTDKMLKTEL